MCVWFVAFQNRVSRRGGDLGNRTKKIKENEITFTEVTRVLMSHLLREGKRGYCGTARLASITRANFVAFGGNPCCSANFAQYLQVNRLAMVKAAEDPPANLMSSSKMGDTAWAVPVVALFSVLAPEPPVPPILQRPGARRI